MRALLCLVKERGTCWQDSGEFTWEVPAEPVLSSAVALLFTAFAASVSPPPCSGSVVCYKTLSEKLLHLWLLLVTGKGQMKVSKGTGALGSLSMRIPVSSPMESCGRFLNPPWVTCDSTHRVLPTTEGGWRSLCLDFQGFYWGLVT